MRPVCSMVLLAASTPTKELSDLDVRVGQDRRAAACCSSAMRA
jgi:hypothetical protein